MARRSRRRFLATTLAVSTVALAGCGGPGGGEGGEEAEGGEEEGGGEEGGEEGGAEGGEDEARSAPSLGPAA